MPMLNAAARRNSVPWLLLLLPLLLGMLALLPLLLVPSPPEAVGAIREGPELLLALGPFCCGVFHPMEACRSCLRGG